MLASRQPLKLEGNFWCAVHNCLLNIFGAHLHIWRTTPPFANRATRLSEMAFKILTDNATEKGPRGTPKHKWEDNVSTTWMSSVAYVVLCGARGVVVNRQLVPPSRQCPSIFLALDSDFFLTKNKTSVIRQAPCNFWISKYAFFSPENRICF